MIEPFGTLGDGRTVDAITLGAPDGLQAQVLTYGGILRRLTFPARGERRDLVLTLPSLDAYVRDAAFLGVIAGRVANRIANARFEIDGHTYTSVANDGPNLLHGGRNGFGKQLWRVLDRQPGADDQLVLGLRSPAGEEGFPGNLDVTATMSVRDASLRLAFEARCDAPTPVSLTWHPYFNLSGEPGRPASEMSLEIRADHFLPVDAQMIPTGAQAPVSGTPFDFRQARQIGPLAAVSHPQLKPAGGWDHCFVLPPNRPFDARLHSVHSGVTLELRSTAPGIQFYGGQHLAKSHPGLGAVCLEPEGWPNAINEPGFPNPVLRPGQVYRLEIEYVLTAS